MPDNPQKLVKYIEKRVLLFTALLAIVFFFSGLIDWVWGVILGALSSLMYFRAIAVVAENIVDTNPKAARISTIASYVLRQMLNAVLLAVSYFRDELSFPAVVIGLILVKTIIIAKSAQERWQYLLDDQIKSIKDKLERRD